MMNPQENSKFSEICHRVMTHTHPRESIGTYKEKIMHLVLKEYFCPAGGETEVKEGAFIADISDSDVIIEIQTGGFYPLKKKITSYLEDTDKNIIIVCPLITKKRLFWVDAESGESNAPRIVSCPKAKNKLLRELRWICELVDFKRVQIKAVLLEADEYRLLDGRGADKKIKATKVDKIPRVLVDIVTLDSREAAAAFLLPKGLEPVFKQKDMSKLTGMKKLALSAALHALCALGIIEREDIGKRNVIYRII